SGHFDTVPLGAEGWSVDPFAGKIKGGRIFGRGSSDMKGGLAAMISAAIEATDGSVPEGGIRLVFTACEELGCRGAQQLVKSCRKLGRASAIIIGEPTGNLPAIGHKGAIFLNAVTTGKTAHSSMPELGVNAIYKAARSISKIEKFRFNTAKDPLLGFPTINVGKINGGMNINSVPDRVDFTIDIRSTTKVDHSAVLRKLRRELGDETEIDKFVDLSPVHASGKEPFVKLVYKVCAGEKIKADLPRSLPYVTDGSVLQPLYGGVPTVILGPGQPEMAHKIDEFCYIHKIKQAVAIYKRIILNWAQKS
ncbi:MAG: M20 family metallopeptidase, partial [Kiritimatiellae bacterium]|nr:M20 family metallopeptidase [Kiritimatiellia bacterium]